MCADKTSPDDIHQSHARAAGGRFVGIFTNFSTKRPPWTRVRSVASLDEVDREIIRLLAANGRVTNEEVAKTVHLSRPAVHARVKRLQEDGVIKGYSALVDWKATGLPLTAYLWVRTGGVRCRDAAEAILRLEVDNAVVDELHRVAGEWCMLLKVRAASAEYLQELVDAIRDLDGVQATMSTIVLSTLSEHRRRDRT